MVDIHCHILPGLDDGAKSLEESVAMVKLASAAGTTDIVATPHANHHYNFDPERIAAKIRELQQATNHLVNLHTGCDFHLSATNIDDALSHPAKYTINHRVYLLVEFSDFVIPPSTDEILGRLRAAGMVPIITHPERNRLLHDRADQIATWVENDCRVQVTAQSFLGRFGKAAKTFSDTLMRNGLIHFVASDGHDPERRPPVLSEARQYIAKNYGEARAEALFVTNPRATLTGETIEPFEPQPRKRKWYELGRNPF
ncbi:MAG: exopolysaccharide biosynthesis protein [Acidobacteriia bacterium]|nr:exopolysaccharide biosynthesis protein [Terriglobia bacterium]